MTNVTPAAPQDVISAIRVVLAGTTVGRHRGRRRAADFAEKEAEDASLAAEIFEHLQRCNFRVMQVTPQPPHATES